MSAEGEKTGIDPTSLNLLEDLVVPEPISWWPLAPAWWIIIAIIALGAGTGGWIAWRRWKAGAYRRAALRELDALSDSAKGIPALLKRVALAAWPRPEVAGLAGERWVAFLRDASPESFDEQSADDLLRIGYGAPELVADRQEQLIRSARHWITTHRGPDS
jgi:hypothetical protein